MAAITAANVVVTLNPDDIDRSPDGRVGIRTFPVVQFGNAALTYPALGVPMPAIGKFGFHFAIKRAYIENPGNGYIYSFDRTNHKVRVWLGAAQAAITVANHVGVAPTGNLANLAAGAFTGVEYAPGTPTGNLSNLAAGAFTGDAVAPTGNLANLAAGAFTGDAVAPTGNLANLAAAAHSHDLIIAANGETIDVDIGLHEANATLCGNIANAVTIVGANATRGGVANATPGNGTGDFVGDAVAPTGNVANGTGDFVGDAVAPTGNVANGTGVFTGDAMANLTPAGAVANGTGDFVGDAPSNLTHTVTGGDAVLESPLAEMDNTVAPASVSLYMEMVGR